MSEEGAGDASNKKGEGEWRQTGKEKRGKKVKAVTNAGVVTSRGGAGRGEMKVAQTPKRRGLDTKKRVQTTSPMGTPEKVDLTGVISSPESLEDGNPISPP